MTESRKAIRLRRYVALSQQEALHARPHYLASGSWRPNAARMTENSFFSYPKDDHGHTQFYHHAKTPRSTD